MASPLEVVRDVPGALLELRAPRAPAFTARAIAGTTSLFRQLGASVRPRSWSAGELARSIARAALLVLAGGLLALVVALLAVGVVLVVVLYVIGGWLVAWWLVTHVARRVASGRARAEERRSSPLEALVASRDRSLLELVTARETITVPAADVSGIRVLIETRSGEPARWLLSVDARGAPRSFELRVHGVEHEREARRLLFALARLMGLTAYLEVRLPLLGLETRLVRARRGGTSHPFRALIDESGERPIPEAEGLLDRAAVAVVSRRFVEPARSVPALRPEELGGAVRALVTWSPGRVVSWAEPARRPPFLRTAVGHVLGTLLGLAISASVFAMVEAPGGGFTLRAPDGRASLGAIFAGLTLASVAIGWVRCFALYVRAIGGFQATLDWTKRSLVVRDDGDVTTTPFNALSHVDVDEVGDRVTVSLLATHRAPIEVTSVDASDARRVEAALALGVELARALDLPWRVSSAPATPAVD